MKITLTSRTKKIAIITGCAAVCVGVLSFALLHTNAKADNLPSSSLNTSDASLVSGSASSLTVDEIIGNNGGVASGTAGTGSAWIPSSGKSTSAPLTSTASKPQAPAKPKIQGDSVNGKQPTNSTLTNRAKKPTYTTPPKAPATQTNGTSGGTTTKKSSGSTTTNKQTNGGSTTGNKTSGGSDQIFKNGYDKGTGGQETVIQGDWGSGSQVGIMD